MVVPPILSRKSKITRKIPTINITVARGAQPTISCKDGTVAYEIELAPQFSKLGTGRIDISDFSSVQ